MSPVPDQLAWAVDALSLLWEDLDTYAFPPAAILGKVLEKLQNYPYRRNHSECSWVAQLALVLGSSDHVQPGPTVPAQPAQPAHSTIQSNSTQESIKPKYTSRSRASLRQWLRKLRTLKEDQPDQSMRQVDHFLQSFASVIRWTSGHICHWKSHNTLTQFYLIDMAWADSELYQLESVV